MRRRRRSADEGDSHERWLVSYADFMTLLFAFFVVLFATSERNVEKVKSFQESIKQYLIKGGMVVVGGSSEDQTTMEGSKKNSPIKPPLKTFSSATEAAQETMAEVETFIEENLNEDERKKHIFDLSYDRLGVRVSLRADHFFQTNKSSFKSDNLRSLDTVIQMLKVFGEPVIVENHVDRQPRRPNPFKTDWGLSSARSIAVVEYMINKHGVEGKAIASMSHGSQRPLFSDPKKAAENQRLEFLILTEDVF